jgi:hypothetical protein
MKLAALVITALLLIGSAQAGDWKEVSLSRHGDNLVFVILPGNFSNKPYQLLCVGSYNATRETGVDCKPSLLVPEPTELKTAGWRVPDKKHPHATAISVNLTEDMYSR